jgi:hypothetical protein
MRLEQPGFSVAACSTGGFERLLRGTSAVAHCSSRSKGTILASNPPGMWRMPIYNFFGKNLEKI